MDTKSALLRRLWMFSVVGIVMATSTYFSISNSYAEEPASTFMDVDYYDGLGTKMRHEKIYQIKNGERQVIQDRIYVDSTNELREEWILDNNGKRIYIRPQDGSIFLDDQEHKSGSQQAEEAKQIAAKRYKSVKSGSKAQPQPAKAVTAPPPPADNPSDLAWDPTEYSNRKLVQDSDCYYREDKKTEGQTAAMRLVEMDAKVCGGSKVTLCVGKVYCFRKGTDIPFSLTVACQAIGPEDCPEPKSCALTNNTKVSPGYGHYPRTGGSKTSSGSTAVPAR